LEEILELSNLANDCHTVGLLTMVSIYQTGQCRLNRMKYGKRMCCLSAMGYSAKKKDGRLSCGLQDCLIVSFGSEVLDLTVEFDSMFLQLQIPLWRCVFRTKLEQSTKAPLTNRVPSL